MHNIETFFKLNYRRMVGYCSSFGHREADVEEVASDVIYRHYEEYYQRVTNPDKETTMRHWMNRRVLLNLRSYYNSCSRPNFISDENAGESQVSLDDPAEIIDLKQRLPEVHPILIEYEPYVNAVNVDGVARGENTSSDKTRFCREKKKLLVALLS